MDGLAALLSGQVEQHSGRLLAAGMPCVGFTNLGMPPVKVSQAASGLGYQLLLLVKQFGQLLVFTLATLQAFLKFCLFYL